MTAGLERLASVEQSEDLETLQGLVRAAARPLGYDRILLFSTAPATDELLGGIYWIEGEWFDDGEAVDAEAYVRHCPITHHILGTDQPFFWTKTQAGTGRRYRFVTQPRGPGLHGLQVPVFGHPGLVGAVSFGGERIDSAPEVRFALTQLALTAFFAARRLLEGPGQAVATDLTAREREVLQWVASGRRVAEVAATLGISDRTVENHLRRIRQRLRVKTTAQAIGAALRAEMIRS